MAAVTITPATGGSGISADKAANAVSPAWTSLGAVVIREGNKFDFSAGSGVTLVLKTPAGFEFNTSAPPNVTFTANVDISSASISFSNSTTMTVTLTVTGTGGTDQLTIGNTNAIQVRPTVGTPLASGQIFRPTSGGGTAVINGVISSANADGSGGSNFGTLSESVGAASKLDFTTQPGGANTGAILGTQPVVKTKDQFGVLSTTGLGASVNVSVALTSGSGPLLGTTTLNIGTTGGNGTATFTNLEIDTPGAVDQLTASASGFTNAVSSFFAVNGRPTISPIPNLTTNEDNPALASFVIGDAETPSDSLILSATSSNTALVPNANIVFGGSGSNRTATITSITNAFGTSTITISVSDGTVSASNSFLLTINSVNDPPTMNPLTNLTILEDAATQTVNLSGLTPGPSNESTQTLVITAASSNPTLIPNPTVNYTNPNTTGTLTFAPVASQFGTATITVIVKDNGGIANGGIDSLTNSFTVTVTSVNDPPTLDPVNDVVVNVNSGPQNVPLTGISSGPSNESTQTLTITATSAAPSIVPNPVISYTNPNSTGTLTFAPATNASGSALITVSVKDNGGTANGGQDTITRQFTVTVNPLSDLAISQAAIPSPGFLGGTITFKSTVTNLGPTTASGIMVTNTLPIGIGTVSVASSQGTTTNYGAIVVASLGSLTNGGIATLSVTVTPLSLGSYTNSSTVSSPVPDPNLGNNSSISVDSAVSSQFAITGTALVTESCTNGAIDPAERVTVSFALKNNSSSNTTNLVATLLATGGVTSPGAAQTYGVLIAGGPAVSRSFTFTPVGSCGGTFTATLQLQDGAVSLGAASFTLSFGQLVNRVTSFSSGNVISIPSSGLATPYPSGISVSGLNTNIIKITVTLNQMTHTQPDDVDVLLVGPGGQSTILMADCGGINVINNVTLTFDNSASTSLPDSAQIVSGTYKPTDFRGGEGDAFTAPAPPGPYVTDLSLFNGTNPNGTWQLYVLDDTPSFSGNISGGWSLNVTTVEPSCCVDSGSIDLTMSMSDAPDPVLIGSNVTFTIIATNQGPATATGVLITNPLPANGSFISATASQGTATNNGTAVIGALGTLANDGSAVLNVTFRPTQAGPFTNSATISANQPDRNLSNNSISGVATVIVPAISIGNATVVEGNTGTSTNAVFTLQLSSASIQTISVNYATVDITAAAGSDYVATNGLVTFAPGQVTATVTVRVLGDNLNEATEFFGVDLSNPTNVTIGNVEGTGTIIDDDPLPSLSISDASVVEGNIGTTNMLFTVTLTPISGQAVSFSYATANGSALAGSDFVATNGTLFINPGQATISVAVPIIGDTLNESNETFFVNLSGVVNATFTRSQAVGTIINDDFLATISPAGATLAAENCSPTNGVIDPNETVTVNFSLRNASAGTASTTNLMATLLQMGGVTLPGTAQTYGALTPGATVSRPFSFTANGTCGDTLIAVLQLQDGANSLGTVTNFLAMGKSSSVTNTFSNTTALTIPDFGTADTYPSTINVTGLSGNVTRVTATLSGLSHTYPSDLEILLVGPSGQSILLMSDAGDGMAITGVNLTFDDTAASLLPGSTQISSGTYKPTDYPPDDAIPAPAPVGPYATNLSVFNGTNPNGAWSLYVSDDSVGDSGSLSGGWSLKLTTGGVTCCGGNTLADLGVGLSSSPASIPIGSNITYTINVTNLGPNIASDAFVFDTLPPGAALISASTTLGTLTNGNGTVACALGTVTNGTRATITITIAANAPGYATNIISASARSSDPNPANSSASVVTPVLPPGPVASFFASPVSGSPPLAVTFLDNSLGTITNRQWNFGNGATTNTTATNFVFTYAAAGTNSVTLTVIGPGGTNTLTRNSYIVITNLPPLLTVNPPSFAFGSVMVAQSSTGTFQVVNSGGLPLNGSASVSPPFAIQSGTPFNLSPGQTGLVMVSFSPGNVGSFSNAVVFSSNGGNRTNTVTGLGFTPPQLGVSPAGLNFGTVAVGSTAQATFVLTNSGSTALTNGAISLTSGAFSIVSPASFTISGFSSTNIVIGFTPPAAGSFTNSVAFSSDGGNSTNQVTGTGAVVPVASFVGNPASGLKPLTVTFTDSSTGTITNRAWDFGDGSTSNTTVATLSHVYPNAGTNSVKLTVTGPVGTNSQVRSNYIIVTNLPPQLVVSPANLDFGSLVTGQTNSQNFQVINSGGTTLSGSVSATAPFSIKSGTPYTVAPGQTGVVTVSFSPVSVGNFSNAATFLSNGGNSTNAVTGIGLTPPQVTVTPSSINFGVIAVGSTTQANFVVTNLGGGALSNGTANVSGGPFSILSGTPFNLPGLGSTNVVVRFAPVSAASFSNVITFATGNAGNSTNAVTGTGAIAPIAAFSAVPTNGLKPLSVSFTDNSSGTITNRFWDFGDGSTTNTTATSFNHTYSNAGTNSVSLTVTGPLGTNTLLRSNFISVTNLPPQLAVSPTSVNFGPVVIGQTNTQSFQIVNTGGLPLNGTATSTPPFLVQSSSYNLNPGQTGTVAVSFAPASAGPFSNVVTFISNGGTRTNVVIGTGLTPGQLTISPPSINFGVIIIGSNVLATFTATNSGGGALSNVIASVDSGPFTIVSPTGSFNLPGFASTNVVIGFSPASAGNFSNVVTFTSANANASTNAVTGLGAFLPVADFVAAPSSGLRPLTVTFSDNSTGTITNRLWDFGDGTTTNSSGGQIVHNYSATGTNTVTLTVSGPVGVNSLSKPSYIIVTNLPPLLALNPTNLDFGPVFIGETNMQSFQVVNNGGSPLSGNATSTAPFFIEGSGAYALNPGETSLVTVTFAPATAEFFTNAVLFLSNGGNSTNTVTGIGLVPTQLRVLPRTLDFGFVDADISQSVQASLLLTNRGDTPVTNIQAFVDTGPFGIISATPFDLDAFATTNLVLSFAPTSAGTFSNAIIVLSDNGGNSTNSLIGTGVSEPTALFSAAPTSGLRPLTVSFTDVSTGAITNRFWDFGDGVTTNTVLTNLVHTYSNAGLYSVTLTATGPVGTNTLLRTDLVLVTNLPPQLVVSPATLDFGSIVVNQTALQNFQVVNAGGSPLTGSVDVAAPFAIQSGTPLNLAAGQTGVVTVSFSPVTSGDYSNIVQFTSNGGNSTNAVMATALDPGQMSISPIAIDFGPIAIGTSAQSSFVITNLSSVAIVNGLAALGDGSSDFAILSGTPFNLPGFGSTNVLLSFSPSLTANFSNVVLVTSSNGGSSTNSITGVGVTPAQLTVVPGTLDLGLVDIDAGTNATGILVVSNLGGASLDNAIVGIGGGPFTLLSSSPFSVPGFGSTNVSILFNPTNSGSFSNTVLIASTAGNSTNTLLGSAAFEPGVAFSGSPTVGVTPLTVTFNDASTGTITNRAWDFGDGTVSNTTVTSLIHTYTNAGSYSVSLNIGGPLGNASVVSSNYILVTNPPPNLLLSPTNLDFGLVAIGQSNVLNFQVVNNGGLPLNGTAAAPVPFTVLSGSPYNLGLGETGLVAVAFAPSDVGSVSNAIVFQSNGGNSTNALTGSGAFVPVASFSANPLSGVQPLTVTFTDNSTGTITNRFWDFGDGATSNSSLTTLTHIYVNAGTSTITLTVTGPVGASALTQTNYIVVQGQSIVITGLRLSGADVLVSFTSVANQSYRLEYTDALPAATWFTAVDSIPGTGGIVSVIHTGGAGQHSRFYRIRLLP